MMQFDRLFLIVAGSAAIGMFVGFTAGLDNPPASKDVQWETLVAGAAAIFGGWMAYSGAIEPYKRTRKQYFIDFHRTVNDAAEYLRAMCGLPIHSSEEKYRGVMTKITSYKNEEVVGEIDVSMVEMREEISRYLYNRPFITEHVASAELINMFKDFDEMAENIVMNPETTFEFAATEIGDWFKKFDYAMLNPDI
ncbi:hypothetical protein [Thalassospira lucentensis]|uniref:hypothetical protein n=1 Tax=Thalassospira lucentensis TaxID=168935 RepID=UPI003AA9805B